MVEFFKNLLQNIKKNIHYFDGGYLLDVGCGTGTWCIEMADAYPSAEVVGVELSPSQPILVPPNLTFRVDDFEDEWTYSRTFDYIHARLLAGRVRDWASLMRQCFE